MAWRGLPGAKPGASPKKAAPAEVARYHASGTVKKAGWAESVICRTLEARMAEAVTSNMSRWSPPAMSLPRATFSPSWSMVRTGAVPEQTLTLESGQWTTVTPASFMAARSRWSDQTQWAMRVRSFHRPNLA